MSSYSIVGTISGTSADGIDIAEIVTDGTRVERFGPSATRPYLAKTERAILATVSAGPQDRSGWPQLSEDITQDHGDAIQRFLTEQNLTPDFVVFHGQTVWHDPDNGETVQLGDPQVLSDRLGLPVISDVRLADMAAGGQGAPLVPVYHQALAERLGSRLEGPVCFLNIGGVSNLTFVDGETLLAFDIGPGNALLDDWVRLHKAGERDQDGLISAKGAEDATRLHEALGHAFFGKPWPKSLDRNAFSLRFVDGLSLEDGAATLAAFTAASIAKSSALLPAEPALWIVCGGGRHNPTLMAKLSDALVGRVVPSDAFEIDGDALEAQAMAFLGGRMLADLPTSYPATTGAHRPVIGGALYSPSA